jgi:hypothetical protein
MMLPFGGRSIEAISQISDRRWKRFSRRSPLLSLPSGRQTLLEGCVLGLPGPINEQPAEQAGTGADAGAEPGVARHRANYRTAAGADGRAAKRALLSWCHVGAGDHRQSESGDYQILFHDIPRMRSVSAMRGTDSVRSETGTTRRWPFGSCDPARPAPN